MVIVLSSISVWCIEEILCWMLMKVEFDSCMSLCVRLVFWEIICLSCLKLMCVFGVISVESVLSWCVGFEWFLISIGCVKNRFWKVLKLSVW